MSDSAVIADVPVCVIGAGVMGLSAAWQIAKAGETVLVLDRGVPGQEASAANAGTLALQNKPPASLPVVLAAIRMWRQLSDDLGFDVQYERRGGFRVAHTPADVEKLERDVLAQRAHGLEVETIYQPQLSKAAPYLSPSILAAAYCHDDGMANPLAATRALIKACARRGATIRSRCGVLAITVRGNREFLLRTTDGIVRAAQVVSATGAWSADVARLAGASLPLTSDVLMVATTVMTPAVFPHIVSHVRGNLTLKQSAVTGKVLIGGAWPGDGDRDSGEKRVRRESLVGNLRWAVENIPAIARTRLQRAWVGFEGRSPDRQLVAGPLDHLPGFFVIGCASGGFTVAPMAGLLAARHVSGTAPDAVAAACAPRRFEGPPATREAHS
jgi:glycine/D-amino acid oxidase-like deaminating enzyme